MDQDEPVTLTREELYNEVWTEPMATLAPKFGLSDVGLAKICRRLHIPVPGRGYWRQKEVGRKVRRTNLPRLPAAATSAMREVQLRKHASGSTVAGPAGPVADQRRFEAREENRIVVPEILENPHPLVARSVAALRRGKRDHQGYIRPKSGACLGVSVTLDSVDRAMCIYDALLKALDSRGFTSSLPQGDGPATLVHIGTECVGVVIEERVDRAGHGESTIGAPPRRVRYGSGDDWHPTGRLVLRIDHSYLNGIRCSWGDGKKQRVEQCLNAFVVGLVAASEALKEQRLAREAWERNWREAEARRVEEARRREEEAARIRALDSVLASWQRSCLVREFAAEVQRAAEAAGVLEPGSPLGEWLSWARSYADRVDPLLPQPTVPEDPGPPSRFGYP